MFGETKRIFISETEVLSINSVDGGRVRVAIGSAGRLIEEKEYARVVMKPDEWDAFYAAGNRALGRDAAAPTADRYMPPIDVLHTEPLCAALYQQGATKDQALAAITSAMQGYRSDAQRRMETQATPMLVKVDHGAEVEALRTKVAELEAVIEEHKHTAWERSERG
jgi:hypothetical protein